KEVEDRRQSEDREVEGESDEDEQEEESDPHGVQSAGRPDGAGPGWLHVRDVTPCRYAGTPASWVVQSRGWPQQVRVTSCPHQTIVEVRTVVQTGQRDVTTKSSCPPQQHSSISSVPSGKPCGWPPSCGR